MAVEHVSHTAYYLAPTTASDGCGDLAAASRSWDDRILAHNGLLSVVVVAVVVLEGLQLQRTKDVGPEALSQQLHPLLAQR